MWICCPDSRTLSTRKGSWRDQSIYEDSSGEGDDYDDEYDGDGEYGSNIGEEWMNRRYDTTEDIDNYDDYDMDPDPDPDFF